MVSKRLFIGIQTPTYWYPNAYLLVSKRLLIIAGNRMDKGLQRAKKHLKNLKKEKKKDC